jgi:hypothetical protein
MIRLHCQTQISQQLPFINLHAFIAPQHHVSFRNHVRHGNTCTVSHMPHTSSIEKRVDVVSICQSLQKHCQLQKLTSRCPLNCKPCQMNYYSNHHLIRCIIRDRIKTTQKKEGSLKPLCNKMHTLSSLLTIMEPNPSALTYPLALALKGRLQPSGAITPTMMKNYHPES